jgi:hypothetical protein
VVWAHADSHLLNINGYNGVIGHAEIYLGYATLDARPLEIGGVGGVATGLDRGRPGIANEAMRGGD